MIFMHLVNDRMRIYSGAYCMVAGKRKQQNVLKDFPERI